MPTLDRLLSGALAGLPGLLVPAPTSAFQVAGRLQGLVGDASGGEGWSKSSEGQGRPGQGLQAAPGVGQAPLRLPPRAGGLRSTVSTSAAGASPGSVSRKPTIPWPKASASKVRASASVSPW